MGLFSPGYLKEGPGVSKNAKKKKGVFLMFEILINKFFKLLQANVLHFVISLPYLAILFMVVSPFVIKGFGINLNVGAVGDYNAQMMTVIADLFMRSVITLGIFNFCGSGPASAAYAYICRCFTRGEHAWLVADGKEIMKKNFVQSFFLLILDVVVIWLLMNAIYFYGTSAGGVFYVIRYITVFLLIVYLVMHYYIYQIMVTYECSFRDLIKYSIIIAIAKLPLTVILTLVCGGIYYFAITSIAAISPFMFIIVYAILGLTFMRFPIEFFAARVIEKNIKAELKKGRTDNGKQYDIG